MLKTVGWGQVCGKVAAASGDGLRVQAARPLLRAPGSSERGISPVCSFHWLFAFSFCSRASKSTQPDGLFDLLDVLCFYV